MDTIILQNPIDMHIHLRQDSMLEAVLPYSVRHFSTLLAMPNLNPPLMDAESILAYRQEIMRLVKKDSQNCGLNGEHFIPMIALYIHDNLTLDMLKEAHLAGVKILKLYPKGATTNAENGVSEVLSKHLLALLEEAQNLDMILSIHGESAGFSMDREREFLEIFSELARTFPQLKIIIEHLSDRHSLECIHKFSNLYGTITLHHMLLTLDDIIGGKLNPFMFCKPVVKTPKDRDAILEAALSGDSKISFGSDSAPHTIQAKLDGAAGIFSAPILLEALCTLFAKHNKLENLSHFLSLNAQKIYNIKLPFTKQITLKRSPFTFGESIESKLGNISVFMGDSTLNYKVDKIEIL
ncbi:dihydroorotase [Helicobacter bilis]|uniref:dihydroorotase n=1 Tax=Helicobacter bilis TaxID=37372 RepID=UPI002942BEFB|nr:dihydroorotase [Helicobacter bilis]